MVSTVKKITIIKTYPFHPTVEAVIAMIKNGEYELVDSLDLPYHLAEFDIDEFLEGWR